MKIIVTGGNGYIGANVVRRLVDEGHTVLAVDNLSSSGFERVPSCGVAVFDYGDIEENEHLFGKVDVLIHLASKISVPESMEKPSLYFAEIEKTRKLLDWSVKKDIKKVIFSSSAAVYGDKVSGIVTEKKTAVPVSPYGEVKLAIERMPCYYRQAYDMSFIAFRFFNVVGASYLGDGKSLPSLFNSLCYSVEFGKEFWINGKDHNTKDGTPIRDLIHVKDLEDALVLGVNYLTSNDCGEIINLGSGEGYSVKEVYDKFMDILPECRRVGLRYQERREGDISKIVASNKKAQRILGWEPMRGLEEMLRSHHQFFINKDEIEKPN